MRRLAPRPLSAALERALPAVRPLGLLAEVQSLWPEVAGAALADAAAPVAERDGVVSVACESAVWAQELELLGPDLLPRLNAGLERGEVTRLRFVVGSGPTRA
jgi:predicted nucleic acid-binding Zn ribbon protein